MSLTLFANQLHFAEGPRWHDGSLWCADMHGQRVLRFDHMGGATKIIDVPQHPSGIGWLPDGRMLVVSMDDQQILVFDGDAVRTWADCSHLTSYLCNDMVVDHLGRAYVGNFGFDLHTGQSPAPTNLILIDEEGSPREVANGLRFPNGMVITPDQKTLIVAESFGAQLTAFSISEDGSLSNQRIWAKIPGSSPDGICLDSDGGIWVASPATGTCFRVKEGGQITDELKPIDAPYACMLGGPEGLTLYILTAPSAVPSVCAENPRGSIVSVDVSFPGAGLP